jgi:hypothetical protein
MTVELDSRLRGNDRGGGGNDNKRTRMVDLAPVIFASWGIRPIVPE